MTQRVNAGLRGATGAAAASALVEAPSLEDLRHTLLGSALSRGCLLGAPHVERVASASPGGERVEEAWSYDQQRRCLVTVLQLSSLEDGQMIELKTEFLFFDCGELERACEAAGLRVLSQVTIGDSVFFRCKSALV